MTLEELQIVLTANIEQIRPAMQEVKAQFQGVTAEAAETGKQAAAEAQKATEQVEKSIGKDNDAVKKSVETTKQAVKQKQQSLEEIAAVAERAAKRYTESIKSMSSGGALRPPVHLTGAPATMTTRMNQTPREETSSVASESALQRLQASAIKAKQNLMNMFSSSKQGSVEASAATEQLVQKLDIINAQADIQRHKLTELQSEYRRVMSSANGSGGEEAEKLQAKIVSAESRLYSLSTQSDKLAAEIRKLDAGLSETGTAATRAAQGAQRAGNAFSRARSGASGFSRDLDRMRRQILSQILVYGLLFNALSSLGTYLWSALKTNTAFSNSLNNLKVQLLTAFQPIYQACLPAITSLINALAKAMAYIAAFISGFFGKTYSQSQQSAAALNKNVKALEDTEKAAKSAGDTAKKAGEEARKGVAGFDEINQLSPKTSTSDSSAADKPATGTDAGIVNTDFGAPSAKPLISEQQIAAAEAAGERVRAVFDKIYSFVKKYEGPIKAAILGIIGAFLLFKTIMFIKGIVDGISSAFAFLAANPAVAVALAIAIIVAGIIYLYNTNKSFHDSILSTWNSIKSAGTAAWGTISAALKNVWDHGGSYLLNQLIKLGASILQLAGYILANFVLPFVSWFVTMISPAISTVLTWVGNLLGGIQGLINWLLGSGKPVLDIVLGVLTGILTVMGLQKAAALALAAKDAILAVATNGVATAHAILNAVMNANPIAIVIGLIAGLVTAFILLWNNCADFRNFWTGLWNDITGAVKEAVNGILYAWNSLAGTLNRIHVKIPDYSPIGAGQTLGFSLPIATYLATGGIVTSATNTVLGEAGTEAVLPLQSNTGWMNTLADKVAARVPQGGSGGPINITLPIYLNRNGPLIDTFRKSINRDGRNSNDPAFSS